MSFSEAAVGEVVPYDFGPVDLILQKSALFVYLSLGFFGHCTEYSRLQDPL